VIRTELIRPVAELLAEHARRRGDQTAFLDDHRSVNYRELAENTARLAGHLAALGLKPGDRALIYLDNSVATVESYLAIPRAGGVAVCANAQSALAEVAHILDDSGAKIVITDAAHLAGVRALAQDRPGLVVVAVGQPDQGGSASEQPVQSVQSDQPVQPEPEPPVHSYAALLATSAPSAPRDSLGLDDVAWMLYTSGTTGRPKGVYLTQRGCLWVVAACWAPIVGLGPDDVVLSPLPLFHSYALDLCVLGVLAVGATERVLPRFSPDDVLSRLRTEKVTVLPGVPTMFHYLLQRVADTGADPGAGHLRMCISAGAIMPAALNVEFEQVFGVQLLDGYGITETSTMVTMNWPTGGRVMGSCGLPLPGLSVRLVDSRTGADALPGEEGEIWVQGPNVTPGYHNLPEATKAVLTDGWYHTGDLARRDENGYLRITGRTKELIIRGGENIYPAEVEDALLACASVGDAAVVGVPHESLGEVPVGFVVPRDDQLDAAAVLAECAERLSTFKVPTRLIEVDQIPRTGSGKILRLRLRERLAE
jgi:acyl-CoA synthetase (AMP-forming)/AMP-acid ligase II